MLAALAMLAASATAQPVAARLEGARPAGWEAPEVRVDTTPAPPEAWIARDKALHLSASFLLTLAGQYVLTDKTAMSDGDALPVAAGAALALGLAKEVADSQRPNYPHFCWRDLAADAVGVALGALVVAL